MTRGHPAGGARAANGGELSISSDAPPTVFSGFGSIAGRALGAGSAFVLVGLYYGRGWCDVAMANPRAASDALRRLPERRATLGRLRRAVGIRGRRFRRLYRTN